MKIIGAEIRWFEKYANDPDLIVVVDELPPSGELRYKTKAFGEFHTLYFAQHESGFVRYFAHDPSNENGFGGNIFTGMLEDGAPFKVKGPWSSRAAVMLQAGFPEIVDVAFREKKTERLIAGALTLEKAKLTLKVMHPDFDFVRVVHPAGMGFDEEVVYTIPKSLKEKLG